MRILIPKVSGLILRSTSPECYPATSNSRYLLSKKMWAIHKAVHFTFCSCLSTLWSFYGLQDFTIPFGCQLDRAPIFHQYFVRIRLEHSSSNRNDYFSGNCTASYSRLCKIILISAANFLVTILRRPGPLKMIFSVDAASSFMYLVVWYKLCQSGTFSLLNL